MSRAVGPNQTPGSVLAGRLPRLERLRLAYRRGRAARRLREQALLVVASLNDGVWEWNPARREILLSERCYLMLGYPPRVEAVDEAVVLALIHPEDRERVLRARAGVAGTCQEYEVRVLHAEGGYRWMLVRSTAIVGRTGKPQGRIGFLVDVGDRKRAEAALRESEARATAALAASGAAVWSIDYTREGLESFDARACDLAGLETRGEWPAGTFCGLLHPEDRPRLQAGFEAAQATGRSPLIEYRIVRPNGELRWLQGTGELQRDATGHPLRFIGVSTDITERKLAERHRELLVRELGHRVKNILSIVQSIADQTARAAGSTGQFQAAFAERLQALTRTHDLLMRRGWQSAMLEVLIEATLAPFGGTEARTAGHLRCAGPPLELAAMAAVSLAMALHELATNAAKYGALACEGGEVALTWHADMAAAVPQVELEWIERGGPPVTPPERSGFGTRLVRAVAHELGGEVSLAYPAEGFECRLRFPLSDKVRFAGGEASAAAFAAS